MKNTYYKFLVLFFYYVGDIACKFNFEKAFEIYQKSMKLSVQWDEKIGYWWWKEPSETNKDL
jgi:hypothetical protein